MGREKSAEAIVVTGDWSEGPNSVIKEQGWARSMGMEQQQGGGKQLDLFDEVLQASLRHGVSGKGGTGAGTSEERQSPTARAENLALAYDVMEQVASSANLNQAYKRVKANKGAPGIDGMTVADLRGWIADNRERLIVSLLDGSYRPKAVTGLRDDIRALAVDLVDAVASQGHCEFNVGHQLAPHLGHFRRTDGAGRAPREAIAGKRRQDDIVAPVRQQRRGFQEFGHRARPPMRQDQRIAVSLAA